MAWLGPIDEIRIKLGFPIELFEQAVRPLIEAYGGWAESLPASESHHRSEDGWRMSYSLEVASRALDYRRGQILPPGAAPEAIGEQAHRWTYAVFVAALLHRVRSAANPERDASIAAQLLNRCVPPEILEWIAMDDGLRRELNAFLSGDEPAQVGAIGRLVRRAEVEAMHRSVRSARSGDCIQLPPAADRQVPATAIKREVEVVMPALESAGAEQADGPAREASNQLMHEPVPTHFSRPVIPEAEYLEDIDTNDGMPAPEAPEPHSSRESAPFMRAPVSLPQTALSEVPAVDDAAADAARRFMGWLQQGLADGGLRINEAGALVHFVDEGMLLVSPRIFKEFAKRFGEDGLSTVVAGGHDIDAGRWIQRQVLRARWHVQAENGINILIYQVTHRGRARSRLCGVVIKSPERFVNPVPPANPVLVRLGQTADA